LDEVVAVHPGVRPSPVISHAQQDVGPIASGGLLAEGKKGDQADEAAIERERAGSVLVNHALITKPSGREVKPESRPVPEHAGQTQQPISRKPAKRQPRLWSQVILLQAKPPGTTPYMAKRAARPTRDIEK